MRKLLSFNSAGMCALVLAVCAAVVFSGCEPLRKKFVRQKKKDASAASEVVPILQPEVYSEKVFDPVKQYKQHYGLWGVWYKDYLSILEDNGSDKRQGYVLTQMAAQLEQMEKLLADEKKPGLTQLRNDLQGVLDMLKTPAVMRESSTVQTKVRSIDGRLRNNFDIQHVQDALIK